MTKKTNVRALVGTTEHKLKNQTVYQVDYIMAHEDYDPFKRSSHEIALVHVSQPIKFNEKVNKVSLQTKKFNEKNYKANFTSWGNKIIKYPPFRNIKVINYY